MSDVPLLTCREMIEEFLSAYVDGELSAAERERFEEHLLVCPACVDYLESYRTTVGLGSAALRAGEPIAEDVPQELVDAILASRRR